jgi:hypothetical protein
MSFMGGPPMGGMPAGQAGNLSAQQMQEQQMIKTVGFQRSISDLATTRKLAPTRRFGITKC